MGAVREIRRYKSVKADEQIAGALADLREYVEHQGTGKTQLVRGIYQTRPIDEVQTTKCGVWEFGYQVKPTIDPAIYERRLFIKLPNQRILDVRQSEREPLMGAVYREIIDKGGEYPEIEKVSEDCLMIKQRFMIAFQYEFQPGIVPVGRRG